MINNKHKKVQYITTTGILGAVALSLSFIERVLLSSFPLPMGIKPGFGNIAVMISCVSLGYIPSLAIIIIKSGFVVLLSGLTAGIISLCGGVLSISIMYLALKYLKRFFSYTGISVLGAVFHNLGQLSAASLITSTFLFTSYLPILFISGTCFGFITGIILNITMPYLERLKIFGKNISKISKTNTEE